MRRYYNLIEYTPTGGVFLTFWGESTVVRYSNLTRGLLEFFNPQDAQLLIVGRLNEHGALLSRLDSGHLWVPYRRYRYFPFFAFIAIAAQILSALFYRSNTLYCLVIRFSVPF